MEIVVFIADVVVYAIFHIPYSRRNKKPILLHYWHYFCEFGLETCKKNAWLCIVVFTTKVAQDAYIPITYTNEKHNFVF